MAEKIRLEIREKTSGMPLAWKHVEFKSFADLPNFIIRDDKLYVLSTSKVACPFQNCQACKGASMIYLQAQGGIESWSIDDECS